MFCIVDASTILKRNRTGFVSSSSTKLSMGKDGFYHPKYCLSLDGYASLYNLSLAHYKLSIQKLLSVVKKYSLTICKEKIKHVGNTYIVCHDDIEVLTAAMNELNGIILLNDLKQE